MLKGNAHHLADKCQPFAEVEFELESAAPAGNDPFMDQFAEAAEHFVQPMRSKRHRRFDDGAQVKHYRK